MTVSLRIDNVTTHHIKSRKANVLAEGLNKACNLCGRSGYVVEVLLLDPEFKKVKISFPTFFVIILQPGSMCH